MSLTAIGAAQVHWRREGSGPPIVFLPGFPLSGRTWDGVVARAGALADLIEAPDPDHEQVTDLAAALRDELRPVI